MGGKLLVIIAGIMRTFEHAWPHVALELRLAELEARDKLHADVLVLTQLNTRCTAKDLGSSSHFIQRRGLCAVEWRNRSRDEFAARVRAVYGPRLRLLVDICTQSEYTPTAFARGFGGGISSDAGVAMVTAIDRRLMIFHRHIVRLLGSEREAARAFSGYDAILALRPDSVLVSTPASARPIAKIYAFPIQDGDAHAAERTRVPPPFAPIDVLALCRASPGSMRLVSGSLDRYADYHSRDPDHGFLLCPPVTMLDWLLVNATSLDTCRGGWEACAQGQPPPRPTHLTGAWADKICRHGVHCDRLVFALRHNFTYDALPETVVLAHLVRQRAAEPGEATAPQRLCTLWRARPDGRLVMPTWKDAERRGHGRYDFQCYEYELPRLLPPLDADAKVSRTRGCVGAQPCAAGLQRPMSAARPRARDGIAWLARRLRTFGKQTSRQASRSLDGCAPMSQSQSHPSREGDEMAPLLVI
jgi:hypothetical protein